jgi:hypothetical protein
MTERNTMTQFVVKLAVPAGMPVDDLAGRFGRYRGNVCYCRRVEESASGAVVVLDTHRARRGEGLADFARLEACEPLPAPAEVGGGEGSGVAAVRPARPAPAGGAAAGDAGRRLVSIGEKGGNIPAAALARIVASGRYPISPDHGKPARAAAGD